jgi:integrase
MSVRKKDGRFYPVLFMGRYHATTGKPVYRWFGGFTTRKQAESEERKLRLELERKGTVNRTKETVAEFLERWLAYKRTDGTAPKTLQGYEDMLRTRWIPAIGHIRLDRLTGDDILDAQTDWLTNGVVVHNRGRKPRTIIPKKQTVKNYRRCLHTALEDRARWSGNEVTNPSDRVAIPNVDDAAEVVTLTIDEARALLAVAEQSGDIRSQLIVFGLHMGMRPGELLGLRKRDVNRPGGYIHIRQTVAQLRKRGLVIQENHAKNRASKAPVELTAGADQALVRAAAIQAQQIRLAGSAWVDHNLVFTSPTGGPINPQWLRAYLGKLLAQAGVTRISLKDLRHTHATLLLGDGVHPKLVQERLRHSRISVTMDTYSHVTPTMRSGTATRFDGLVVPIHMGEHMGETETGTQPPEQEFGI